MSRYEEDTKMFNSRTNDRVKCSHCGHSELMFHDKCICTWCGHYVYKNKKIEFKEKMKTEMRKKK